MHHSLYAFHNWPYSYHIGSQLPELLCNAIPILRHIGLACFTFISGYVLFYQSTKRKPILDFVIIKLKRLIVPCLLFTAIYVVAFSSCIDGGNMWTAINGTHLWYLPMIFLCIIILGSSLYTKWYMWIVLFFMLYLDLLIGSFIVSHYHLL